MNTLNSFPNRINPFVRLYFRIAGVISPQAAARKGAELFCMPDRAMPRRALSRVAASDAGAEMSALRINGHDLIVYAWGDWRRKPYVLLAHGWREHALFHLDWVQALLSSDYAVVAFDQPAHGHSDGHMATLSDFACNLLAVGRRHGAAAAVIGYSFGGAAAAVALRYGLDAGRAILIAPPADPEQTTREFAHRLGLSASSYRCMLALLERRSCIAMGDMQAHRTAPAIGRPALVVHDLQDMEVPWAEGERYARHWPQATLLTTTGLGHRRVARDPDVITSALRFLAGDVVGDRMVSSPNLPYGLA